MTGVALESAHGTLTANTAAVVLTTTAAHTSLDCFNSGTVAIFGRLDGRDATVGGAGCFVIPAANTVPVSIPLPTGALAISVNLISSAASGYSVVGRDR